ncbi:hypothetical protein [Gordonia insulae]|uniref:Uncharacterized protein n=1 Tax=Gordonia insulae TaxID=2420509 RepID=A0A3G8JR85_9ACTN|nr:hypothetical protein [Gordonia insulae]AZG46690.1 hypothetical protein D7316_03291 [Gordonia insulae]
MLIALVIVGAAIYVLTFFLQPSLDYDGHEARQFIAARDRAARRELRRQERSARRAAAQAPAEVPRRSTVRPTRAWVLDFATQMRSIL